MSLYELLTKYPKLTVAEQEKVDNAIDNALEFIDNLTVKKERQLSKQIENYFESNIPFSLKRGMILFLAGYLLAKKENK